jgi:predicted nuclease of predicted toxin-antitoxin system
MNFLVDEKMPRTLAPQITDLGFDVRDVRNIGLRARPDSEVMGAAIATDAIIIRDRGFANPKTWPDEFTADMIFVVPKN